MKPASRLPGIRFISQPPYPDDKLPRMDVAAFIGFARSGPLHTPVPVESMQQFRNIFGEPVALRWDAVQGVTARGYLYATVAEFFANGGIRCWIVRVAGNAGLQTFTIDNLLELQITQSTVDAAPVLSPARSPGSWAQRWRVRAAIRGRILYTPQFSYDDSADFWSLRVAPVSAGTIQSGELIGVNLEDGTSGYIFVDKVTEQPSGLSLRIGKLFTARVASPSREYRLTDPAIFLSSPDQPVANAQRLRLDLIAEADNGGFVRVDDLAFSSRHPRFWGQLPNDHTLFAHPQGEAEPLLNQEQLQLRRMAQEPRFPLAGPDAFQHVVNSERVVERLYLPLSNNNSVTEPEQIPASGNAPANLSDGLESLNASLFLNGEDVSLPGYLPDALRQELAERFYIRQLSLKGIYSLFPIQEVSFVSVPDLVHLSQSEELQPIGADIPLAPRLFAVTSQAVLCLDWESKDAAFELQSSDSSSFNEVKVLYQGERKRFCLPADTPCRQPAYYRVRIRQGSEIGLWSNPAVQYPLFGGGDCATLERMAWYLSAVNASPSETGAFILQWQAEPADVDNADSFILQESDREDFTRILNEHVISATQSPQHQFTLDQESIRFFRIRGVRDDQVSLWSNSLRLVTEPEEVVPDMQPASDAPEPEILAVHRALINFCAARRDMLAILTLPEYGSELALRHINALPGTANSAEDSGSIAPARIGDSQALNYAAAFHPWLAISTPSIGEMATNQALSPFIPCDGGICGTMAATALSSGSWIAPANIPLANVVALHPVLNEQDWVQLAAAQINLLRVDGRGFAFMGADTLSNTTENRPLNVRRLLIMLRKLALREGALHVFEPDSIDFRNRVHHYFNRILANLYSRGAFAGETQEAAYRVVTDSSVNTRQSIEMGRFIVELRVAPSRPLEFLTIRLAQSSEGSAVREGGGNG